MAILASFLNDTNPGESLFRQIGATIYQGSAQPFTITPGTTHTVDSITLKLLKTGAPTQANLIRIKTDNAGLPGSVMGTNTLAAASIPTGTPSLVTVSSFDNTITLQPSTTYWLVWETAVDGTDDVNYYQWRISNTSIVYPAEYYKVNGTFNLETGYNSTFMIQGSPAAGGNKNLALLGVGT